MEKHETIETMFFFGSALATASQQRSGGCWQEREFLTLLMQRPVMDARINARCVWAHHPLFCLGMGQCFFFP